MVAINAPQRATAMSSSRLEAQSIELEINLINGNSLKNKHRNGYYLYKLLWCVI